MTLRKISPAWVRPCRRACAARPMPAQLTATLIPPSRCAAAATAASTAGSGGHVDRVGRLRRAPSACARRIDTSCLVHVEQRHPCRPPRPAPGDGEAEPGRAAGDDRASVLDLHVGVRVMFDCWTQSRRPPSTSRLRPVKKSFSAMNTARMRDLVGQAEALAAAPAPSLYRASPAACAASRSVRVKPGAIEAARIPKRASSLRPDHGHRRDPGLGRRVVALSRVAGRRDARDVDRSRRPGRA